MTSTANDDPVRGQAVDWLMQLKAAPDDAALHARLERWLAESDNHRRAYESVERMWRVAGGLPGAESLPAPERMTFASGQRSAWSRRWIVGAGLALAACLLLLFLPTMQLRLEADHLTGTAELRDVVLEDGSTVRLDAVSAVAVHYEATRREVRLLSGQAFFEVVPKADRPFVVTAGDVTATATGTAFAVRAWDAAVTVAVQSGVVEVTVARDKGPAEVLTRGQMLSVARGDRRAVRGDVSPDDVAAWRERRLVVDGATLADVVEELGRHNPGAIVLRDSALAERRVTGVFDLRQPIEALEAVARTQRGSITRITPYLVIVSGP